MKTPKTQHIAELNLVKVAEEVKLRPEAQLLIEAQKAMRETRHFLENLVTPIMGTRVGLDPNSCMGRAIFTLAQRENEIQEYMTSNIDKLFKK